MKDTKIRNLLEQVKQFMNEEDVDGNGPSGKRGKSSNSSLPPSPKLTGKHTLKNGSHGQFDGKWWARTKDGRLRMHNSEMDAKNTANK